jgi:hypothetical protein
MREQGERMTRGFVAPDSMDLMDDQLRADNSGFDATHPDTWD